MWSCIDQLLNVFIVLTVVMEIPVEGYQRIKIIRSKRKATTLDGRRWPNGVIPFTIDNSSIPDREVILQAMEIWEKSTCIKFFELTEGEDIENEDKNRVVFFRGTNCWASVGRYGFPEQYVSLGEDCDFVHVVLHEIGHVVGFEHEHKRPDRDKYVRINWLNINKEDAYNYEKRKTLTSVPYDLYSIMHYSRDTFSSNGLPTVLTVDPLKQYDIGKAYDLSFLDIKLANKMYSCNENCTHRDFCKNGGFVGSSPDCQCICPYGFYGNHCHFQTPIVSTSGCRHRLLKPGKLTSPNFPVKYGSQEDCIWYIKAKKDQTITLTFIEFDIEDSPGCRRDYLNVRTKNMYQDEDRYYCGRRIPEKITTEGNEMMLLFITDYIIESKGFSAKYTFNKKDKKDVHNPNCFERSCYEFLESPSSHAEAKQRCVKKGASLLMVSTLEENTFLKQRFGESLIGSSYWIDFPEDMEDREPGWEWGIEWYDYLSSMNGTECCINRVYDDWISEYCVDIKPYTICETKVSESIEPEWRQWSEWSGCTATCGGGFKTKYRHCNLPGLCNGTANATAACNTADCPGSFAQGKATNQSSTVMESWKAVDSFHWPRSSDGSCCVTEYEWEAWWVVDLGKSQTVVKMSVTIDAQRLYRMRNVVIRVGDSIQLLESNRQCRSALTDVDINNSYRIDVECSPTPNGRYLSFEKEGNYGRITICEIDVFVSALQCPFLDTHLVFADSISSRTLVSYPDPKFIDNTFKGDIKCSIKSGSVFPVGRSIVSCTADMTFVTYQNMCSFAVNVQACKKKYNGSCYAVVYEKNTYMESRESCRKMGFDLVNLETLEENNYVWKELLVALTDQRDTYIAPNDKTEEGVFILPTGENITFTNWDFEQPNNYGHGQHCAVMYKYEGQWGDEDCQFPRIAVCEAPLPVEDVPNIEIQIEIPQYVNEDDAFNIACRCEPVDPTPIIDLYKENHKIKSTTGLNLMYTVREATRGDSGVYTCVANNDEGGRDSSSRRLDINVRVTTPVVTTEARPETTPVVPTTIQVRPEVTPPIPKTPQPRLETTAAVPRTTPIGPTKMCDNEYKGVCYFAIKTKQNFKLSKRLCRKQGGQLVKIRDFDLNNFVRQLVKLEAYIGLTDMQSEGNWKWLAGGKLKFEKWIKNQPDNKGKGKGEDCVAIKPNGGWRDVSCKRKMRAICELRDRE